MKKTYEAPEILLTSENDRDVIATSSGDTPLVDAFDW